MIECSLRTAAAIQGVGSVASGYGLELTMDSVVRWTDSLWRTIHGEEKNSNKMLVNNVLYVTSCCVILCCIQATGPVSDGLSHFVICQQS